MPKNLNLDEEVLLAAVELEVNGRSPFTAEDIAIAAWEKFPDSFSMEGHAHYPDSNRVYTKLMGKKGLVGRGWFVKVSEKRYHLSEAGRIKATVLSAGSATDGASRAALRRDQKRLLSRLMSSRAVTKIQANALESVGFHDACSFWDISPRSGASVLQARLQTVEAILETAETAVREHVVLAMTQRGSPIQASEIETLRRTHQVLLERFKEDLDVIRRRQDERVFR